MPGLASHVATAKKRKRQDPETNVQSTATGKTSKTEKSISASADVEDEILLLESQILESRQHYNKVATLLSYCQDHVHRRRSITAAVALCRIFCRLLALGSMSKANQAAEHEVVIVQWLQSQLGSYEEALLGLTTAADPGVQNTAVTLLMRLLKAESESPNAHAENIWRDGTFASLISRLIGTGIADAVREEFVVKYLRPYPDVRYYTFVRFTPSSDVLDKVISILSALDPDSKENSSLDQFYVSKLQPGSHRSMGSIVVRRKQAQELWLKILRSHLTKAQRKTILQMMAHQIAPCFTRLEFLMDFLTDSFNAGGSMSLAALAGLFYLMQEKNLDYPQFYPKLYSLLNADILHSRHRSRFFRLLNTFLSSTHLPAALVASFMKRLARLTLSAPPSGIVFVVPWIYNLLKNHPACTFMIHREPEHAATLTADGMDDPFNMEEADPMETGAIESSLWEIQTLQAHYHPNVAAIGKVISEQFTKQGYQLEDFLDHTYTAMLSAELSKDSKKPPVIEYEIPKKIFFQSDDDPGKGSLLIRLWDFSWLGPS
ncbi:MAG: hypothetical protein Q9208_008323 [Pyrenodesmia sp. 3 TL-2023]